MPSPAISGTVHVQFTGGLHFSAFSFNPVAATAAVEGKMSKGLKKVLKKVFVSDMQEQLAVADAKLGSAIKV